MHIDTLDWRLQHWEKNSGQQQDVYYQQGILTFKRLAQILKIVNFKKDAKFFAYTWTYIV